MIACFLFDFDLSLIFCSTFQNTFSKFDCRTAGTISAIYGILPHYTNHFNHTFMIVIFSNVGVLKKRNLFCSTL